MRASKKIRYAVVGAGNIAQVAVLPAFRHAHENSELAAVVSSDAHKRAALSKRYGVEGCGYEDLERIIQDAAVDAAYLAVPNTLHRGYTERCARAGVHVLCEKPMAMSAGDCAAMMDACEAAGVKLMVAYRLHFEEATLTAIEAVRNGAIGEPRYISSSFSQQVRGGGIRTAADVGGGALYDLGVYQVNAARCLFAAEPEEVIGSRVRGADARFQDVDEMAVAVLRFPGDRIAQLVCSQGAAETSALRIVGTAGSLRLEPAFDYSVGLTLFMTAGGKTRKRTFKRRDQFAPELVTFSRCILEDTEPEPSGEEGLADVRVLEAVVRSSSTGESVALPPFARARRPGLAQEMHMPAVDAPEPVNAPSPSR